MDRRPFDKKTFDTLLHPGQEEAFQFWKQQNAPNDSGMDYDLRGAFLSGLQPDPVTKHWPDTFKKPNHPTFSNESQYAEFGNPGSWTGPNHDVYVPPVTLKLRHVGGDVKQKSTTPPSGDVSYGEIGKQHARHLREGEFADSFLGKMLAALGANNDNESK